MTRCLTIFAIAIAINGCCQAPPAVEFECPPRPVFGNYSEELWSQIPSDARIIITADDLAAKRYIRRCEERARVHNERM